MSKIDTIIDALQKAKDGWQCFDEYEKALAAARELKALKPVAYSYLINGDKKFTDSPDKILMAKNSNYLLTPLYALDEVTK